MNKLLQWIICLVHANELPFRYLFQYLDIKTSCPKGFFGQIGTQLEKCEDMETIDYTKLNHCCHKLLLRIYSDHKYLFEIIQEVASGIFHQDIAKRNSRKLAHSCWLKTDNRILHLYESSKTPPENLKVLTEYVIKMFQIPRKTALKHH